MPTYTYECKKCGSAQDEFHMMSAAPAVKCTSCGSKRMHKMPGAGAGIIFKGSGFYETDYKRADANGKGKADSKPDGASKTDSASKTDGASKSDAPGKTASTSETKKAAAASA